MAASAAAEMPASTNMRRLNIWRLLPDFLSGRVIADSVSCLSI